MFNSQGGFAGLVSGILHVFDVLLPVLAAAALLFFLIGAARYVVDRGEHERRTAMLWSLIALFVIFSIWGILRILSNTLLAAPGENSTGVNGYFGDTNYQNTNSFGGPR